jgi:muconolactone delta-isomerase
MKFLVIATPKVPAPPDMILSLIDRAEEWQKRYDDQFEAFGLFPGGGGFATAEVSDEAELHRIILEMPFSPFSDHEIRPIVDGPTGWRQAREAIAAMMASA